jgi:hypothetical protein
MANTSAFFDLILPGKGEYRDAWWDPINSNFTTIDTWAQGIELELVAARFSKTSLSEFLAVGHDSYGELKPTPEVLAAQISPIYGFQTPEPADFDLSTRTSQVEWEMWYSREGQASLRGSHAFRAGGLKSQVLEGTKDGEGYPTWLGSTGADAHIDGSTTNLWLEIDGTLGRVRTDQTVTVSGSAGTWYLYATLLVDLDAGKVVVDGGTSPATSSTGFDVNNNPVYFSDIAKDFTTLDVKVGDLLVLEDTPEKGNYVIKTIAPNAVTSQLEIIGQFPVGGYSAISYKIYDPLKMAFGSDSTKADPVPAGKFYIGEADFDGSSITAVRAKHFRDTFIGEWRPIDVSSVPTFEEVFEHNLDSDVLDITIQVSQEEDGSAPIEELSLATVTNNVTLSLSSGTLALNGAGSQHDLVLNPGTLPQFTQGTFVPPTPANGCSHAADQLNPGTLPAISGDIIYVLTGSPTGTVTADIYPDSSAKVKWTKSQLWVKNAVSGKFYKDYDGAPQQAGFLRVIVRKRG